MLKKTALLVLLLLTLLTLTACNTMQGLGRDVQSAGEGIQDLGASEVRVLEQ